MSRNSLYLVIVLLGVGLAVAGYLYWQESKSGVGINIEIGEHGIKIEEN